MKHDDASSNSMFGLTQGTESNRLETVANDLAIEHTQVSPGTLAAKQDYQERKASIEDSRLVTSSVVDNFLPAPNRLLAFGGLGLVGALWVGGLASTLITYRTTVKAQAVVEPAGELQVIRSDVAGTVDSIFVEEYESLKPGQMIASFDNSPLRTKVSQIETQIASTKERIAQINGQLSALDRQRSTESAWLQQLTIADLGIGNSLQQIEYSRSLLLEHRSDLQTQLRKERGQLERAQQQMDKLIIRSPEAGKIYDLVINKEGQTIEADEVVAKVIPDGVGLEIKALVSDTDIKNIQVGYPTQMNLPNCAPSRFGSLSGEVSSIELAQPDVKDDVAKNVSEDTYMVTVKTQAETLQSGSRTCKLLPGMEGEVTIIAKQEKLLNFFLRKLRFKTNA